MPVKNAGKFLDQCVDSIIRQVNSNWELIAIDDGSTDHSLEILESFSRFQDIIHVAENKGEGIIPALQQAFEMSKGEYITRMDADDVMPVNKLESLYHLVKNKKRTVVTGKVRYISDRKVSEGYRRYEKWLNHVVEENAFNRDLYRECVIASPNWMVHRSCFENDIPFESLTYPEDYDLVFNWHKHGYEIKAVDAVTHLWREHDERTSRHSKHYQQLAFFRLKTAKFIENFKDDVNGVQLIGKGTKGKLIARILKDHQVDFEWFDLAPTKQHKSVLDLENRLSILSNWPKDEKVQHDISEFLRRKELKFGDNLWLF